VDLGGASQASEPIGHHERVAYAVVVVLMLLFGVCAALLAVLPPWLGRPLKERMKREQANMRSKGWRNAYFNPDTDSDRSCDNFASWPLRPL
jgi:hypothetical protein